MSDLSAPVDMVHQWCVDARQQINDAALDRKMEAARWEPRPMPPGWRPDDEQ